MNLSKDIKRPSREIIDALSAIGADSVTSTMDGLGVSRTFIEGPIARVPGSKICGPALTLQFLPMREDQMAGFELPTESEASGEYAAEEENEQKSALWEVFEYVQPGDIIVVDGRGDTATGAFGEMLMTYFKGRGGAGVVIDTGIRDSREIFHDVKMPVWSAAVTTGGAGHLNMYPSEFNVPVACGNVLVNPGDIIMADDGGAIVIPPKLAPAIIEIAGERDEHEVFVRMKLGQGGDLNKYYPFNEEGRREYEEWLKAQSG